MQALSQRIRTLPPDESHSAKIGTIKKCSRKGIRLQSEFTWLVIRYNLSDQKSAQSDLHNVQSI